MSVLMLSLKEGNFKMVQNEIKMKIDSNNREIEELLSENEKLQSQCKHEYKNGECIWCYKKEETN